MKIRFYFISLLFLLFTYTECFCIDEASLKRVSDTIGEFFIPVELKVIKAEGDVVVLNGGIERGLSTNMVLTISRGGYPFYHPITGALIGYTEKTLGFAQLYFVGNGYSFAKVYSKEKPKEGDIARITKSKIPIYLFPPVNVNVPGFDVFSFYGRMKKQLEVTGRFIVYADESSFYLASRGLFDPSTVSKYVDKFKDYNESVFGILSWVTLEDDEYRLDASLISLNTGKKIRDFKFVLGKSKGAETIESNDFLFVSGFLEGTVYAICAGDIEGGKSNVVIVLDNKLVLLRYESGELVNILTQSFSPTFMVFNCDVADLNGDGFGEVVLTGADLADFNIRSEVYGYKSGSFKELFRDTSLLRFYKSNLGLLQTLYQEDPLSSPPSLVKYDGKLRKLGVFEAAKGDLILGSEVFFDRNKMYIVLNDEGRIILKDETNNFVTDIVGRYGNRGLAFFYKEPRERRFYFSLTTSVPTQEEFSTFKDYTLVVPGRSVALKNGDDLFLAVFKNNPFQWGVYSEGYASGELKLFRWSNGYFEDVGYYKVLPEGIIDIYSYDVDGDGNDEILVATVKVMKGSRKGTTSMSRIYIYKVR